MSRLVPRTPENPQGEDVGVYAPDGMMPQLFLWLSPEMQQERATLLAELGTLPDGAEQGGLTQDLREHGGQARSDERSGGYASKEQGA